jgi:excisionase family DNA binding protein
MREVLTPEEVADYLQLTSDTIYRLIREHRLAATRIGRTYRIPKEDLDTFILTNSTRPLVRRLLFERVMEIGKRNPDVDGDKLLEELEEMDEQDRRAKQ